MTREDQVGVVLQQFFEASSRYAYRGTLGSGGMGAVFRAWDAELEEEVAVKVLLPRHGAPDDDALARFKREISLSRSLRHPNVARVYDLGTAGGLHYLTMEFVDGSTLADLIEANGPLPPPEAVGYLRQIALGAGAAHEKGIVHRDLKPQNVIVEPSGAVAILDFGLAYRPTGAPITGIPRCIGTPRYIAPEQARGLPVDPRADVYSIGVIAFEMLTGDVPFRGPNAFETALKHVSEPIPAHRLGEAGVPPALRRLVLDCLAKAPADRPLHGSDLEARLAYLASERSGVHRKPVPRPPAPVREGATSAIGAETAPIVPPPDGHSGVWGDPAPPAGEPLPLIVDEVAPARPPRTPVVLVADDDEAFRRFAVAALGAAGLGTRVARTGQEALEQLHEGDLDLALIDVWMPDVDGFDVLRVHRAQRADALVPALLVSASLTRAQIAYAIQLGALEVLVKPLSAEGLAARVRAHLDGLARLDAA